MTNRHETNEGRTEAPKRAFVSRAQVLPENKRGELSEQEKEFEKSCGERGVWLQLFCPDDLCLTEGERIRIPVFCEDPELKKSVYLELLCPGDSCEVFEPSGLP